MSGALLFFWRGIGLGAPLGLGLVAIGLVAFAFFGLLGRELARSQRIDSLALTAIPLGFGGGALICAVIPFGGDPLPLPSSAGNCALARHSQYGPGLSALQPRLAETVGNRDECNAGPLPVRHGIVRPACAERESQHNPIPRNRGRRGRHPLGPEAQSPAPGCLVDGPKAGKLDPQESAGAQYHVGFGDSSISIQGLES